MGLQAPPTQRHETIVVTAGFQFKGQLESVGAVGDFVSSTARISLSFYDVQMMPLSPNFPLKSMSRPHIVVLKSTSYCSTWSLRKRALQSGPLRGVR